MKALAPLTLSSSLCFWLLSVSSICTLCFCNQNSNHAPCIATERLVLIQLKNNLIDHANRLSSWVGNDCCSWSGVVCNNITGNVQEIRLRGPDDTKDELEEASKQMLGGTISPSVTKLLQLTYFDLSSNDFGLIPIPDFIGSFQNLRYLNISKSQFSGEIPHQLGNLSTLRILDLHDDPLSVNLHSKGLKWLMDLKELQYLDVGGIDLAKASDWFQNLESIDLAYNQLTGTIPDSVGSLHLLKTLQMNINQLTGSIPDTIGGLSSLNFLDLSYNNLNGSFPESIGRLGELVFLTVHHNSLTGIVTENHFTNLTSLTTLWIGENKLTFKLNVKNWIPPFKLQVLRIGFCNLGPRFPLWIQSQTSLTELDLANTNISDLIPNWIWTTFSSVTYFNISHNNIQGMLGNVSFLTPGALLDLSYNSFHGLLPGHFNRPDLDLLDLSSNSLSGSLEEFLCSGIQEPRQLSVLNLANNNMSGVISDCWTNWESLVILNLEKNQFSGIIPSSIGNISSLLSLDIRQNKLSGNLPVSLLNSKSLIIIELAENELVGRIPTSIGRENTSLKLLSLRSNKLEGKIPDEICHLSSIQIMDLAHNDLSGNLPTCFTNLTVISGKEKSSPFILYDELFQNQVLGSASLVTKGQIPNSFSKTGMLESLDLSVNHLNGNIPSSLSSLTSLSFLDVSYNNLVGRIPTGPQLQTFNESSFIGNKLCGDPLPVCSPNTNDPRGTDDEHDESDGIDWILVIFTVLGLVIGFWIMIGPLIVSKRWRNAYYHFLEGIWIKLQNSILIIFPCFRRRKPGHEVFSSIEQVQQFDLSQYIYDDKLKGFHPESSSSEASSSTQKIPHSDNKKA
ncbi:putative non-specific serine/threonine protein kinase [Helianthus annuus]|nr:putative non-specific serine/threonine protein kinase [Helianthus annuus]KAJ0553304.1 putative non-specific serine/threonine protein kinase [Helianthus annuus]KAJ0718961.1 putative non-specific serine/threonine protein kinase [Helianthus annuus]